MASDAERTKPGDQSLHLQILIPHRENDAFARAYAVKVARVASITTTSTALPGSKTSSTGFLDLPRELRDNIYDLAVVDREGGRSQVIESASTHGIQSNATFNDVSSLGRVCKQVRQEALEMYFKNNRFVINRIQVYENGSWLGWPSNKKMADLLKRLGNFEISFWDFPGVCVERQSDGTWEGEWDDTDWSFLCSEDNDKISDGIIEDVCQATDGRLGMLLVALKEDRERIADTVNQFKNDILLVYTEARNRASEEANRL